MDVNSTFEKTGIKCKVLQEIIVETDDPDEGIIAELKYTKDFKAMEKSCEKALKQIKDRRYQEYLLNADGKMEFSFSFKGI